LPAIDKLVQSSSTSSLISRGRTWVPAMVILLVVKGKALSLFLSEFVLQKQRLAFMYGGTTFWICFYADLKGIQRLT
jgi:hypothetical protein